MTDRELILVVDDDRELTSILSRFLERQGHSVIVANTGREGLKALRRTPISLVLLDLRLTDIAGEELMREAARLNSPPEVVIITGHATLDSAIAAVEGGAAGYILKPVEFTRLSVLLEKLFERRRLIQENARLQADERRRARETELLLTIAQALNSPLELKPLLKEITRKTAQAVGVERCSINLFKDGYVVPIMSQFADGHTDPSLWQKFKAMGRRRTDDVPAYALAIERRAPVVVEDVATSKLAPADWRELFGMKSVLVVPLIRRDEAVGILDLDHTGAVHHFTDEQVRRAMAIGDQVALAMDNAELYEQAQRERRRLEVLYDVSRSLAGVHETDQILSLIVGEATRLLGAEAAGLRLLEGEDLVLRARTESAATFLSRARLKVGESLSGLVVATGEPVMVDDLAEDTRYDPAHKRSALALGFHGFLGVPMRAHGQTIGTLNVYTKSRRRFTPDEISLVSAFADQASMAIEKGRLFRETEEGRVRLAQIFDSTSDGIMLVNRYGRIESANRRAGELLAFDPATIVGLGLTHILVAHFHSVSDYEHAVTDLRMLLANPDRGGEGDLEIPALRRILHWVGQPTKNALDDTVGLTLTFQDVTQEREVSRMKSDFVSFVTHQLRTPLAGIKWMLELAGNQPELGEDLRSYIQDAQQSAERLIGLVNDLLDISRLERGKLTIVPQEVHLAELTQSVLEEMQPLIREKGHRLSVFGTEKIPPILADSQLLRQVVLNLVSNAIKYTPPRGEIAIRMSHEDSWVRWAIQDNGIGIPNDAKRRLFEKFYRAENVLTIETDGTGLGLYLVRLIMEQLGGRVWCESAEGKGAAFLFALPLRSEADGHQRETHSAS